MRKRKRGRKKTWRETDKEGKRGSDREKKKKGSYEEGKTDNRMNGEGN